MRFSIGIVEHESGYFLAHCPSLPGCRSQAKTREEVRARICEAISGYLAALGGFVPNDIEVMLFDRAD
jgi:antitoxin HicB